MTAIYITERDIEALSRLAYQEARSIAKVTGDPKAAYGSIADAVLNRVMTGRRYLAGDDFGNINISGAINKDRQFTPVPPGKTWEILDKAPPEVKEIIREHLSDRQKGGESYAQKNTHYLNPTLAQTAHARATWAEKWRQWPSIGVGNQIHYFGTPDRVSVPDYVPMYEPAMPPPTPRPPYPNANKADEYAYAGLTRWLAPSSPIDREFHTERGERQRLARTLLSVGLLGLDGRTGVESHPDRVQPVQPGTRGLPPPSELDRIDTRSIRGQRVEGNRNGRATGGAERGRPTIYNDHAQQTTLIRQMQQAGFDPREIIQTLIEGRRTPGAPAR